MDYPNLCVVMYTYDRPAYAEQSLRSVLQGIHYSGKVFVHIADDGSPDGQIEELLRIAEEMGSAHSALGHYDFKAGGPDTSATATNAQRGGYGASYNLATQVTHLRAQVFLALEDDWELKAPLDLDPLVQALQESPDIECIRLGYIGWTQELRGRLAYVAGQQFLVFDPDSPERHVFAGHPRLETLRFEREVGPWPEGQNAGTTEYIVAGRREARTGVAWPLDLGHSASQHYRLSLFAHIGAVQAREDQRPAAPQEA